MLNRESLQTAYVLPANDEQHVRVNFITSADGAVTIDGSASGLGNPNDQLLMKVLRSMADVVLVGAGTVRNEGYGGFGLKPEDLEYRKTLGKKRPPRMAIVTNSLELNPGASVFKKFEEKPIIFTNEAVPNELLEPLKPVAEIYFVGKKMVETKKILQKLKSISLLKVLCEGGPHLFGSLLDEELIDEVCLTVSPNFVGGSAGRITHSETERARKFELANTLNDDSGMLFLRYTAHSSE